MVLKLLPNVSEAVEHLYNILCLYGLIVQRPQGFCSYILSKKHRVKSPDSYFLFIQTD